MTTLGTWLQTRLRGRLVGRDGLGNAYYEDRRPPRGRRPRRWVIYGAERDPSAVPPEWHGWLHRTTDAPLPASARQPWQLPHLPNRTGTAESYRPPGHDYAGGRRPRTTGDYEAWSPDTPHGAA